MIRRFLRTLLCLLAISGTTVSSAATPAAVPDDSIYKLEASFSDQAGTTFTLASRQGKPQLVAMFYTSCRYVCPLIVDSAKGVEHALTESERSQLGILLVSLDPARDDTAALKSVFDRRKLDPTRWTLARTSDHDVRSLAALLGVRYRALADGEFNHTSSLVLLDAQGRRVASTTALGAKPNAEFIAAVRRAIEFAQRRPAP
jgi:protein SCO1/2